MSAKPEIERKFLIVMPDEGILAAQEGAFCDRIVQTYLTAEPGVTARVRRREGRAGVSYTHTEKRRLTNITAWEDEREIDGDEYRALLERADPALRPIEKRRWTVPSGGLLLEIDIYPFWQRQAVLEVELPAEDTSLSFPPFLRILREVTDDRRYKNVSLARCVPPEE